MNGSESQSRQAPEGVPLEEPSREIWLGGEAHVGSPFSSPRRQRSLAFPDGLGPLALAAVFIAGLALGVSLTALHPSSSKRKNVEP
jgi:hypothetical protein